MNAFTAFRATVVAAPVMALLAAIYSLVATPTFPQDWQDILAWSGVGGIWSSDAHYTAADIAILILGIILILIAIGNQVALFFYWRPSRVIFLILTIIEFTVTPFLGLTVSLPIEALGYELSVFLSGITLGLLYFSPAAARFQ